MPLMGGRIITQPTDLYPVPGGRIGIINQSGIDQNYKKLSSFPADRTDGHAIWKEIDGYREEWDRDNNTVERVFVGPWGDRKRFVDYMLGYSYNQAGTLSRVIPAQHPEYPWVWAVKAGQITGKGAITDNPWVWMPDAIGNPIPDGNGWFVLNPIISYFDKSGNTDQNCCFVPITYKALNYEIYDDDTIANYGLSEINRYVIRKETYALQALQVPGWQLKWAQGGGGINEPVKGDQLPDSYPTMLFPTRELTYTWVDVPDVPEDGLAACAGKVNNTFFDPPILIDFGGNIGKLNVGGTNLKATDPNGVPLVDGQGNQLYGYPPGTVLFLGAEKERHRSPVGRASWDITYRLLFRPQTHNYFPFGGKFWAATNDGTINGTPLYKDADFSLLFKQPNPAMLYQGNNG